MICSHSCSLSAFNWGVESYHKGNKSDLGFLGNAGFRDRIPESLSKPQIMKRVKGGLVYKTRCVLLYYSQTLVIQGKLGRSFYHCHTWGLHSSTRLSFIISSLGGPQSGWKCQQAGTGAKAGHLILPSPSLPADGLSSFPQRPTSTSLLPESSPVDMFTDVHGSEYGDGELEGAWRDLGPSFRGIEDLGKIKVACPTARNLVWFLLLLFPLHFSFREKRQTHTMVFQKIFLFHIV